MRTCCIFLALCLSTWMGRADCDSHHHRDHGHHEHGHDEYEPVDKFSVHQMNYQYSTVFEMSFHGKPHGAVEKIATRWFKNKPFSDTYYVYDKNGEWCATAYSRYLTFGFFYPSLAEFDIYAKDGSLIGVIDGQVGTSESAKYSIYNAKGDRVAIAYYDLTKTGLSIVHPEKTDQILVHLKRNFVKNQIDYWDVVVYDANAIDPAIVKVFAAFAVDYQAYFKADL